MGYEQALIDLKNGEIDKIEINPQSFPAFQKAWSAFPYQNAVKGIAQRAGQVTYIRTK
ncbi:hypothetical protein [Fructobacillus ficulneus]|uniref:Uncharacterized protein n=1 Tax=Fructobacillus ficulneus TaxID=157463 RepID=A0A0K8MHI5_9LACO|nr:hypothetical protein [Fructobacillus ficulneus]GAP00002.1 hypothetical protein FFIC_280050 [Fructobacillus ficulneus]